MDNSATNGKINVSMERQNKIDSRSAKDHLSSQMAVHDYSAQWIDQMEQKQKKVNALIKQAEDLQKGASAAQQKALQEQVRTLKEQLYVMTRMKETGSTTVEEQLDVDKQIAKVWEQIAKKQYEAGMSNEKLTKKQEQALIRAKKQAEDMNKKTQETVKEIEKQLDNMSGSFFEKMADGAQKFGDKMMNLMNTININKLAEGLGAESSEGKNNIMNNVKAQFGMTSNREFENFKNDLLGSTQKINDSVGQAVFGAKDVSQYMAELSRIGITSQDLAKQQLEAVLVGNKYLGVSNETQELLVNQMKRSGDTTLMQKHNNKIAALLQSQIGLTQQQLDESSKKALGISERMYGLGWSNDEIDKFTTSQENLYDALKASGLGEADVKVVEDLFDKYVGADYETLVGVLGENATSWSKAQSNQDAYGMLQAALNSNLFGNIEGIAGMSDKGSVQTGMSALNSAGFDVGTLQGLLRVKNNDNLSNLPDKLNEIEQAVKDSSNEDTNDFLKNIYLSMKDKISNYFSLSIDKLPWAAYIALADAAFAVIIASQLPKAFENIGNMFKGIKSFGGKILGKITGKTAADVAGKAAAETVAGGATKTGLLAKMGTGLKTAFTTTGKSGLTGVLSSTGAKVLGGVGGGIALGVDAYKGVQKADEWGTSKTSAGIGGALGGTSSGLKGALGGAAKGAALGTMFGPIGTAIGAGVGGILGAIGGEKLAKGFDAVGGLFKKAGNGLKNAMSNLGDKVKGGVSKIKGKLAEGIDKDDSFLKKATKVSANIIKNYTPIGLIGKGVNWLKDKLGIGKDKEDNTGGNIASGGGIGGAIRRPSFGVGGGGADYSHKPWPITAGYPKYPSGKSHSGVDFGIARGTPVGSSVSGTVEKVVSGITREGFYGNYSDGGGYGNHVKVRGLDGNLYTFAHLKQVAVSKGDKINAGTMVGWSGNTGNTTGPHLHYQVNGPTGATLDPFNYFSDSIWYPGNASGISYYATEDGVSETKFSNNKNNTGKANLSARTRYISPGLLASIGAFGIGGADGEGIGSAADRIIAKLDELAARQDAQEGLLQAFSNSNRIPKEFGGAY